MAKKCSKCGSSENGFTKDRKQKDGLNPHCKLCTRAATKAANRKNPGVSIERNKRWRKANPARAAVIARRAEATAKIRHPERYMLKGARHTAKKKGYVFDLTVEDIVIPEFCPVFPWIRLVMSKNGAKTDASPSIDRFDNSKGYVKGNVSVISWRANRLKCNASLQEIKALYAWATLTENVNDSATMQE